MSLKDFVMPRFQARPGDQTWGRFNYPVTITQKNALDAVLHLFAGTGFEMIHSQKTCNGDVILVIEGRSVTIKRSGRMYPTKADGW